MSDKIYETFKILELGWFYNYVYSRVIDDDGNTHYGLYEKILDNFNPDAISTDKDFIKATVVEINDMFDLSTDEAMEMIKRFYSDVQEMLRPLTAREGMALIETILSNTNDMNCKCDEDWRIDNESVCIITHLEYINNVIMPDIRKNGLSELRTGKILIQPKYYE